MCIRDRTYGVYNKKSTRVGVFAKSLVKHFVLKNRVIYVPIIHEKVTKLFGYFTKTPSDIFQYAADTPQLDNPRFEKDFHDCKIPAFKSYEKAMLKGAKKRAKEN